MSLRRPACASGTSRARRSRRSGEARRRSAARERTPLDGERADVLICGASFAGLAVARELAGSGADVLVVDRYEIGERATERLRGADAVAARDGRQSAIRQEIPCMAFHTPHGSARFRLPWSWSSFDYSGCARQLLEQTDARFEIAKVEGTDRQHGPHRPR